MGNSQTKTAEDSNGNVKYIELFPKLSITKPTTVFFGSELQSSLEALTQSAKRYEEGCQQRSKALTYRTDTVEDRTPTIGFEGQIYSQGDNGFFTSVLTAYNHHFNLRTSPDDWWYCVIRRVAMAIDENSKKQAVREMFVDHEGQKELAVEVPATNIYDVDYSYFFDAISKEVSRNIKIPKYVDCVTADFSSTTLVTRMVSQITLMSSVQEFFKFTMFLGCGIPGIEMTGNEEDWKKLLSKVKILRSLLKPIEKELGLKSSWWAVVTKVFKNLLETYRGRPDKTWWGHILTYKQENGSFPQHQLLQRLTPTGYSGWIAEFLEGRVGLNEGNFKSGIVTVPLYIKGLGGPDEKAALVAGMLGYTVHDGIANNRASIQPFQGWALLLDEDSPLRRR